MNWRRTKYNYCGDNMKNITMLDIAKKADVSKSTVSRALNGDPRVNEDTRSRIIEIAREMNYRPHQVAQALAKKNTNIIGVILPGYPRSVADPFFLEFLQGIGEVAVDNGYSLTLPSINKPDLDIFDSVLNNINVDGVILTEPVFDDPRARYLRKKNIPFVFNGNPMVDEKVYWVDTDNEIGAYRAVNYLIKSGHKRIATITGSLELVSGKYRFQGYKKALREQGIEPDPGLICNADFTEEGAYQAARLLLEQTRDFTAIFAANDLMALGVINALKEEGISIPDDVAVMGYDGIKIGEFANPSLTTIKNPSIEKGRFAMNLLIKILRDEKVDNRHVLLPPQLVVRNSA